MLAGYASGKKRFTLKEFMLPDTREGGGVRIGWREALKAVKAMFGHGKP